MGCQCCQGDRSEIIIKRCPCWVMHYSEPPWMTEAKKSEMEKSAEQTERK